MPELISHDSLIARIRTNAETIARATPPGEGVSWDDPEEWLAEAAELAHDVLRWLDDFGQPPQV